MNSFGAEMVYYKPWTYFIIIQSIGLLLFIIGMADNLGFYLKGKAISLRNEKKYSVMIKMFFKEVLFQRQLMQQSLIRWFMHILIFWGFLALLSLSAISVLLETAVPASSHLATYFTSGQGRLYYKAVGDAGGLMILVGALVAFVRRYLVRPEQVETIWTDSITLNSLIILVLTGFTLEAMRIASLQSIPEFQYSFVANRLAGLFKNLGNLKPYMTSLWAVHATLSAALIAYIPHSKLMHIFSTPAEIVINASEEGLRGDLYGNS
ncbi:MAG: respiratory nitrate reductase subunit gamma [Firmicutes bacterium]|nr:respiratory nitrate reductase subunit gamma [Bacillota bacterium]